jgi:hypothetical protein
MTNAIVIIILLAVLAFTFAIYSRMGDMIEKMDRRDDYLTGLAYKLTEVRNNANDAGKKSAAALESIHETLKGIGENTREARDNTSCAATTVDDLVRVLNPLPGDVRFIKEVYKQLLKEAVENSNKEGSEAEAVEEPKPEPEPEQENEPEPEPEPEVAAPSFEESQGEVLPKVEEEIVEAPTEGE